MIHVRFAEHRMRKKLRHLTHTTADDTTTQRIDQSMASHKPQENTDTTYEI